MNYSIVEQLAKIAIAKSLVKEYKTNESERTVYLNNGTEFQIYLKNPYQKHIGVKVYVNEQEIGGTLILKPGQSCWLERFMNNEKRFLFSTYEVENTQEMKNAISKNGKVKIDFFMEREPVHYYGWNEILTTPIKPYSPYTDTITWSSCNPINCKLTNLDMGATLNASGDVIDTISTSCCVNSAKTYSNSIEAGRVEKGSKSDQKFKDSDVSLEYNPFKTEIIQILPHSRKQVSVNETRRRYCGQCGKKVSPKDKYCSNCGAKLI